MRSLLLWFFFWWTNGIHKTSTWFPIWRLLFCRQKYENYFLNHFLWHDFKPSQQSAICCDCMCVRVCVWSNVTSQTSAFVWPVYLSMCDQSSPSALTTPLPNIVCSSLAACRRLEGTRTWAMVSFICLTGNQTHRGFVSGRETGRQTDGWMQMKRGASCERHAKMIE